MLFNEIYEEVKRLFPKFYQPDSHINNIISDTYYLYSGKNLEGSSVYSPELNCYFIKDKDIQELEILECVFDNGIITSYILPYYIDYNQEIDIDTRVRVIYKLFEDLCDHISVRTDRMKTILKYAPYVLTVALYIELDLNRIDSITDILNTVSGCKIVEDFTTKIQDSDIEILLNKGLLYGIVEECKMKL